MTRNKAGSSQNGGGIYNAGGNVTLTNSRATDNEAANGGGIYNFGGTVTLNGSNVTGNDAGSGGGISNNGTLILTNGSQVAQNTADGFNGGGIANGTSGSVTIQGNSSVTDNETTANGGGISTNGGSVTLNNGSVTFNRAGTGGGIHGSSAEITLDGGTITDNVARSRGGGIFNDQGSVVGRNGSSVTANVAIGEGAVGGGGIYNQLGAGSVELNSVVGNTPNNCRPTDSVTNCED